MHHILPSNLQNTLVISLETVAAYPNYNDLPDRLKHIWDHKVAYLQRNIPAEEQQSSAVYYQERAHLYAEFGKIICIGLGAFFTDSEQQLHLKVTALQNESELELLELFCEILEKYPTSKLALCAHNGKDFHYPYLCRRLLINNLKLPIALELSGKKPWEVLHFDTMEFWRFGDYRSYVSLPLLALSLGIEVPEMLTDEIKEENLVNRVLICKNTVIVTAQVLLRFSGLPVLDQQFLKVVD